MFKKPSPVHSQHKLSGADKKKLRRAIAAKFPAASDEDLDALLSTKADVTMAKLANRALVYVVDGGLPMLFDSNARGDLFPTVYALWKVPRLLPFFRLKGWEVSHYILGGADLMFPGIRLPAEGLPSFEEGEVWSIMVPGNPAPIAVGSTLMSSKEAEQKGFKGKALRVVHYYRDTLWESAEGCYVPNAGFGEDVVMPDPASLAQEPPSTAPESSEAGNSQPESSTNDAADEQPTEGTSSAVEEGVGKLIVKDAEGEEEGKVLSVEDMDALLDQCLLQALHASVKDKELPLASSMLWAQHILPNRPADSHLDVKKSTHKKLSKWLQAKAAEGLISVKEDKHRKEVMLLRVNRSSPAYTAFRPQKKAPPPEGPSPAPPTAPTGEAQEVQVSEVWKVTPAVLPVFNAVGAETGKYYTAVEAGHVAFQYVEQEKLDSPTDRSKVVLDVVLCDALFKGAIKKGTSYPTEVYKADLTATFLGRMQAHHRVARGDKSAVRKGALKPVQVVSEVRSGRKKVTRLSGVESFLVDAEKLAEELQHKFACSTSVQELPGKKDAYEVLVQGGVLEDLARHMNQAYGIPKKHIEIMDKTRK